MRESPALKLIELLRDEGCDVGYHDPHVARLREFALESVAARRAHRELRLRRHRHGSLLDRLRRRRATRAARRRLPQRHRRTGRHVQRQGRQAVTASASASSASATGARTSRATWPAWPSSPGAATCPRRTARATRRSTRRRASPPTSTICWPIRRSTRWRSPRACRRTIRSGMRALAAGKHVFIEKPLAASTADARELVAAAEDADRRLMVGHLLLFHPALRRSCRPDRLGRARRRSTTSTATARTSARCAPTRTRSGASARTTSPSCSTSSASGRSRPGRAASATCARHRGRRVRLPQVPVRRRSRTCTCRWLDPHKMRRLTVVGSEKMVVFDDMETDRKVTIYDKSVSLPRSTDSYGEYVSVRFGDISIPRIANDEPLRLECQEFVDAIRDGREPRCGGREGLAVVEVLEAMQALARRPAGRVMARRREPAARSAGPNLHVGDDVTIGDGVEFGANVVVHDGCSIGAGTRRRRQRRARQAPGAGRQLHGAARAAARPDDRRRAARSRRAPSCSPARRSPTT